MRRIVIAALALSGLAGLSSWVVAAEPAVPTQLESWRGWVLDGQEYRRCPFLAQPSGVQTDAVDPGAYRCAWPERLSLDVTDDSARFSQRWEVYSESWVALPGTLDLWPRDVTVDGASAPIVARAGLPQVRLAAGSHAVSGRFVWSRRPEVLPIPNQTALVDLTVNGARIAQPDRPDGALALGRRQSTDEPRQLDVQVFRLVQDEIPARLVTRVRLQVAGDAREESLGKILPAGFVPLALTGDLPARLEPDGVLRAQVRPGSYELVLSARGADVASTLSRPAEEGGRSEIWSYAGNDRLRVAVAEGAEGVDPAQANVPDDWRGFPAFRMPPAATLKIVERSRGLTNADENRLRLQRRLWLDFERGGFTAVDQISGTLRRDWQLAMGNPWRLESARTAAGSLLIITPDAKRTAVELRDPNLSLTAISRLASASGSLPATGWSTSFEGVTGELYLPPGHRLLASLGVDRSPTAWLDQWGLWNLFGVLIIVVFARWVAGPWVAGLGLVALVLTYQAEPAFIWVWGNLLVAIAIAKAAPEGRLRTVARGYRAASFVVLGLALVPFAWTEVRHSIYPQLEVGGIQSLRVANMMEAVAPAAAPPPPVAAPEEVTMEAPMATDGAAGAAADAVAESDARMNEVAEAERRATSEPLPDIPGSRVRSDRMYKVSSLSQQNYAAGTLLQAGPGIPGWSFGTHPFSWSGPVEPDQTVRFITIGPALVALWRIAGVVLLVAFFALLARTSYGNHTDMPTWLRWVPALRTRGASAAAVATLALLGAGTLGASLVPSIARAEAVPEQSVLDELRTRLTRAPTCAPTCAEIAAANVRVAGDRIVLELQATALAPLGLAMPNAGDRWNIESVTVDGQSSLAVTREGDGGLWVPLDRGTHRVRIEATLGANSLRIAFPQPPRAVSTSTDGWSISGVNEGRLVSGAIDLARERNAAPTAAARAGGASERGEAFPPFVEVVRDIRLDLDWAATTQVRRIAPADGGITVSIPLVAGESVLTEGLDVRRDGTVLIGLDAMNGAASWESRLARADKLDLALDGNGVARTEIWRFIVSPQWHVDFGGLPAVLPDSPTAAPWIFEFRPRRGEKLEVRISRPTAAPGRTLAFDSVTQRVSLGKRASDHQLELHYRSTQGGRHAIAMPKDANVTGVTVDGAGVQLRPENGELSLALLPGEHTVQVNWRSKRAVELVSRPDVIDLRAPASNVTTTIEVPDDRWPLAARGPGVGPAVLYWGELLVFIVTAILLGRMANSPLRTWEWLLLGLGLSTLSWVVLVLVAAWLFAVRWRDRWQLADEPSKVWLFNGVQIAFALFTAIAVVSLVFSGIRYGLLASPDMGVAGPGSGGNAFTWFVDRTESALPQPLAISVPLWIYRAAMFAWALWIALALARWLRLAWTAWTRGGLWREEPPLPRPGN